MTHYAYVKLALKIKICISKPRDEFAGHSKTVHNDILGGMNNWLEHRCPLSVYGCGFRCEYFAKNRKLF